MSSESKKSNLSLVRNISIAMGGVFSVWASIAVISGLASVNWQVSELLKQYMMATGLMQEFHTFVDFYTHIKGVEYIICLAFLCSFPLFYRFLNKPATESETV